LFAGLLPRLEDDEDDEGGDDNPPADVDAPSEPADTASREWSWREIRFELMWLQHGGSGLGMRFDEVGELDLEEIFWLVPALAKRRQKEADALKRASKSR